MKKKLLLKKNVFPLFVLFLLSSFVSLSQNYNMGNGTINTCSGTFYDPGGSNGNYSDGSNYTQTICSNNGQPLYLDFTSFNTESITYDYISIYDGSSTGATLLGTYGGSTGPGTVVASGTCLTIVFHSDGSFNYSGWAATIGCGTPPPPPQSQFNTDCAVGDPFCTGTTYSFPNNTNVPSYGGGGTFGCLGSTPNPVWYYLQIANSGNINIGISQTATTGGGLDVDFCLWGPFTSVAGGCPYLSGSNIVSCSYSTAATETATIPNAVTGQFYILLLTNYANKPGTITFSQTSGSGSTNCDILCNITAMTATPGACSPATSTFSASGTISTYAPPSSGTLTISSSCGGTNVVKNPAFTTSTNYTITNIPATGGTCTITAVYSADPTCTFTVAITAPPPCATCTVTASNTGPYCAGSTIQLNATAVSGGTYTWSGPGGYSGTGQNPTRTGSTTAMSGTYTVTVVAGSATCTATTSVTVNALPAATASNTGPYCAGSTISLSAGGGGTYSWSGPSSFTSTAQNPTRTGSTTAMDGIYSVTVTVGSCTAVATTSVVVNPLPVPSASNTGPYCPGATISLSSSGGGTYSWSGPSSFSSTSQNPTRTGATTAMGGVYTVTVTASGCTATASTTVTVNPTPTVTASNTGSYCAGAAISLSSTGGGTYSWSGPSSFTSTAQNPTRTGSTTAMAGTYTVTVTALSCTATATTSVVVNPLPTPTASNTGPYCVGGAISLSSTGGGTYSWSGPPAYTSTSQNPVIAGAATNMSGTYTVTVTAAGCVATATTSVVVNPLPVATASNAGPYCAGGTIALSSSGGGTYSWSGPSTFTSTSQNPTRSPATTAMAGTYTVTVTNLGCTATATTSVVVNPLPVPTASNAGPYCAGATIALSSSGGGTYSWSGPSTFTSTSQNPTRSPATTAMAGTYTVTVTNLGCTATATTSVVVNPLPVPAASNTGPYCAGATIALSSSGGGTYSWSGPNTYTSTTQNPTIGSSTTTMGGVYTVTVTVSGCTATATTTVTVNPIPLATASNTGPYCVGNTIALSSSGGGTYSWSGPNTYTSTTQNPTIGSSTTGMSGAYTVTVTASGCTATATTTVTVNAGLVPGTASNGPVCANSALNLTCSNGVSWTWTGPNGFSSSLQNPTISPVTTAASGTYSITVTNASGCTGSGTLAVTVNPLPVPTASNAGPYCEGTTIALSSTGGGTYSWSGPSSFTSTAQNPTRTGSTTAMAGTYTVTVTNLGCTATATTAVVVNPLPVPTASNAGPYCAGQTIALSSTGGGTYSWSGPSAFTSTSQNPTRPTATTAMAGTYTVTVTALSCTATATTSVVVNPLPVPTASNTGPYCEGASIALSSSGGGTYSWSGPNTYTSTTQNPTIGSSTTAMGGVYTVTVTASGCTATASTTVTVNPIPLATASNTGPYCVGNTIALSSSGGGTYSWSGPNTYTSTTQNPTIGSSTTGMSGAYTVTVTASGCTATATTTVTVNAGLVPGTASNGPVCANDALNLTCSNGVSWSWTGPNGFSSSLQNPTISPVTTAASGTYSITVTNASGCTGSGTLSVVVNPLPVPTASNAGPYCEGTTIALSSTGGGTYSWSGPNTYTSTSQNPTIASSTTAMAGTYTVTVTNLGCTATATTTVVVNPLPVPTASNAGPYCAGQTIALSSTGGGTYSWSGPSAFTSASQNPTRPTATTAMAGTYTVTVTALSCTATATTSVVVNPLPVPTASNTGPYCEGASIALSSSGGGTYSWSGPNTYTSTTQNPGIGSSTTAMGGVYTVTVTVSGCTATASTTVTVNPIPLATASDTGPYCVGNTIALSSSGGGTYSWSGPNSYTSTAQNPTIGSSTTGMSGAYTVTVTALGCTATATTNVTVNAGLVPGTASNGPVCEGSALNLTCSNGVSWTWTGPNGFSSSLQNPTISPVTTAASGTYSITVTNSSGCTGSGTLAVTVNPLPVPTASNAGPYCEGTTIALSSTGGGTYSWSGPNSYTSTSQNPTIASSTTAMDGTYTVTVTASGCTATATTTVVVNPLPVPTASNTGPYCAGETIALSSTGGGTYSWSGPNAYTSTSQNPSIASSTTAMSGVYTLTVTLTGCTATATTTVTVNPLPVPSASNTGPYCEGTTIDLSSGGGGTYSWSGPSGFTSTSQNPAIASSTTAMSGVYTVTVTLGSCTATAATTVTVNPMPVATASNTGPYCVTGTIALSSSGGGTYSWSGPNSFTSTSQNPTIAGATAAMDGVYTVTVTLSGCVSVATTSVVVNVGLVPGTASNSPVCDGDALNLTCSNGVSWTWTGPNSFSSSSQNPTISPVTVAASGTYSITLTDANGCTGSGTIDVTVNPLPVPTAGNTGPYCEGATISLSSGGGTSYSWSGPNSYTSASQNPTIGSSTTGMSGDYTVTVTALGCTATATTNVVVNPLPVPTAGNTGPYCAGETIALSSTGGGTYSWSGPNTYTSTSQNPNITSSTTGMSGAYTVTVTALGCTATASTTVTVNPLPVPTASNTGPYCEGATVSLSSSGGDTYSWSGPDTYTSSSQNPTLAPGTTTMSGAYTVTVTLGSCTATAATTVTVNPLPVATATNTGPYCVTGTIALGSSGGGTYSWSGPNGFTSTSQNPTISGATAAMDGVYTVTVTLTGCVATATTTVVVNTALIPGIASNSPVCDGDALNLTCSNGVSWSWTGPNGFTDATQNPTINPATPAATGTYSISLVDANGCVGTGTLAVTVNPLPNVTVNSTAICIGQATAALTATNATSYVWTTGTTPSTGASVTATPTVTTSYTVTGTDANGCVNAAVSTVTVNPLPVITVTNTGPYCVAATIQLNAGGGTNYAWTGPNGFTDATANPSIANATTAEAGTYSVTVTDANGCTSAGTTDVVVNTALVPGIASNSPVCEGDALNLTCSNGVSWNWTGPNGFTDATQNPTINPATPAATGTYSISLVDANGCVGTGTLAVTVNPLPNVTVNSVAICIGQATATLTANNATSYAWTAGTTPSTGAGVTATPTVTTDYTVTGTDANGCVNTAVATVTVNPVPVITVSNTGAYCLAATIQLNATGGTGYAWTGPNGFTDVTANPSIANATTAEAGTYSVTVTDANGCVSSGTTDVVVNTALVPGIAGNTPLCDGDVLHFTCSNGVSWSWTGPNGFSDASQNPTINPATPAATGTYSIAVTDANGCVGTATIDITVNALPVVTVNSTAICVGQAVANLTAAGADTYVWTSGTTPSTGATVTATPTLTTTYTVTGTDVNGCVNTAVATVTVNPLPVITVSNTGPYCVAATIQLNATGGTLYDWTGPNAFTDATANPAISNATTAEAGTYSVTVTDANGCVSSGTTDVVVNTALIPDLGSNSPICEQQALNLTCTNGVSWNWTGPNGFTDTNQNPAINPATPAATGTYSISLVDANGCVGTGTIDVVVNALPVVTVNSTAICIGQAIANLTANGASSYAWSAGTSPSSGAAVIATPSSTTDFTVTGTDGNGCTNTAVATVTVNPLPVITVTNTGPYCLGATIQLDATGGTGYVWSGPNAFNNTTSSPTITPAATSDAGSYDVTVTDANGCTSSGTTTVVVNTALVPDINSNSPICDQQALNLTCSNGVAWVWTGPNGFTDNTQNPTINPATPLASGTYNISLTDANGCVGTGSLTVVVNTLPVVTVNSAAICIGQSVATLTANGANSYTWSAGTDPSAGAIVTAAPGITTTYTVTGTDANGCADTSVAIVTVNPLPPVTVNSPAICPGFTATLTANGATTYAWTSGTTPSVGATVTTSPAATDQYTVTGTDANGCVSVAVSTVTVNPKLVVDAGLEDTVCTGTNIILTAVGPAGTSYTWNPGNLSGASQSIPATSSTTYTLSGVDANGCTGTDSVFITVPAPIVLNAGGFAASCKDACDGQLVALPSPTAGAFAQYTYMWMPGGYTTNSQFGVCAGNYTVTVTNNAGCVATNTATVTEPTALVAAASGITGTTCNGVCDGGATITAGGGTSPYSYSWSSLGAGTNPTNLCAGNYTCTVTDANNCVVPVNITITQPTPVTASVSPVATICIGQTATVTATAGGGNGGYQYTWTGGPAPGTSVSMSVTPNATTVYSVSVTDANGCTPALASVTVTVNPPLSVVASNDVIICAGQNANMSATANGGDGVYQYTWATGTIPANGPNVSAAPAASTTYTVVVTDGCGTPAASDSIAVTVNPLPVIAVSSLAQNGCAPFCTDFMAVSTPAIATANWTFTNGTTATGSPAQNICFNTAGAFGATINVTDVNGCQNSFTDNNLVTVYPVPVAAFSYTPVLASEVNPVITFTDSSYAATVTSWMWTFGNPADSTSTLQNPVFDYVNAGTYDVTLTVTTANGCTDVVTHPVTIKPEFVLYVPNAFSPNEDGVNDLFFPKGVGVDTDHYQMWIYDRWGNMIFSTEHWEKGWDGKVEGHDNLVQQDVYVWKIKLKTWDGQTKGYVGHVTVVR